jgi:uncharacterized protein (TIGR02246 family)
MSGEPGTSSKHGPVRAVGACVTTLLATLLFLVARPGIVEAQAVGDLAGIRARTEAYLTAWNAHDAAALAELFAADADFVMGNQPVMLGRRAIREWWQEYFANQEPERRLTLDVSSERLVAADVAVVTLETTTGGRDPEGQALPARRFRGTWLWQRRGGTWLILAMRGLPREEDRVVLHASREAAEALSPDIRAFVADYADAFETHDPSAVSAFYRDDAEIIVRNSPLIRGRDAVRDWWRTYFSQPRPYRVLLIVDRIRRIGPSVALVGITATGAVPRSEDRPLPLRYARATWVLARQAGDWRIAALWVLPSEDDAIVRDGGR